MSSIVATKSMYHDDSTDVCSKCRSPPRFQPRVNVKPDSIGPSTSNPIELRKLLSLCDEDMDDYDAEITRLQFQKRRLKDYKTQIHLLLCSFHRLPNEILCIIFELICAENLLQEHFSSSRSSRTQLSKPTTRTSPAITSLPTLVIGAVCTKWRSLVLASPGLWSRLRLETSPDYRAGVDSGFMATLRLFLDRSVDAPLTISMKKNGFSDRIFPLILLLKHSHRWRSFDYTGYGDRLSNCTASHFPILENLTLRSSEIELAQKNYMYFVNAPKLRTVTAGGWVYNLDVVWDNLTSLDIWAPEEGDKALHDLTFSNFWHKRRTFEPSITSLAKLESFTFMKSSWAFTYRLLRGMFSSFTFPSLNELVVFAGEENANCSSTTKETWPSDAFSTFITRSGCVLTTLSLTVTISDLDLIAALRILPSLTNLAVDSSMNIIGCPISSRFISCMHASSPTLILPRLYSLYIKTRSISFDDTEFIDMISSRWLPNLIIPAPVDLEIYCLRSLVLHFLHRTVDEVYEPLWHLDKMGMRVVVTGKEVEDLSNQSLGGQ